MPTNYQPAKEFPDQKIKLVSIYDTVVLTSCMTPPYFVLTSGSPPYDLMAHDVVGEGNTGMRTTDRELRSIP
jgi:hypothetical protein